MPVAATLLLAGLAAPASAGAAPAVSEAGTVRAQARVLVANSAANARITSVLPGRARNAVLGPRFTFTVYDQASGQYVFSKNAAARLKAASTTKIITAAAVLQTLGAGHRMPTKTLSGGPGVVVLRAGGDPLLTSANLKTLARDTAAALRAGAGGGGLAPSPSTSPTPDLALPNSSTATEVVDAPSDTVPGNSTTSPSPSGGSSSAAADPQPTDTVSPSTLAPIPTDTAVGTQTKKVSASAVKVKVLADDSLFPGSGRSHGWRNSYLPSQVRPVNAFARDDNKSRDAAADAGKYFTNALRSYGITATYGGEGVAAAGSPTLASYAGHSIGAAVSRALLISDNDTAEMLFRQVAVGRGQPATWAGARQATTEVLRELNVPLSGVQIVDGSGLSLDGRLTAGALTKTLSRAISSDYPRLSGLRGWLPVAGKTGTLAHSARRVTSKPSKCAAGKIQAKTGTVADSVALAGYANGADGNPKVFVAIVNARPTAYSRLTTRKYVDRAVSGITGCW